MTALPSQRHARAGAWWVAGLILAVALGGCLKVPLGDPEHARVDPALIGVWMKRDDSSGEITLIVARAWDQRTYHLSQLSARPDPAGAWEPGGQLLFKAWLTDVSGRPFVTMQLISQQSEEPYIVARLDVEDGSFEARGIKPGFVREHDIQTPEEFRTVVEANIDNLEMYEEPQRYFRADGPDLDMVREILKLFQQTD